MKRGKWKHLRFFYDMLFLENPFAPFRFFTPLPHQLYLRMSEGQWVKKPFEGGAGMVPHPRGEESGA